MRLWMMTRKEDLRLFKNNNSNKNNCSSKMIDKNLKIREKDTKDHKRY
jgi:hypothetical protein